VDVEEVVVYDTISSPQRLTGSYDGILFYSPSMVRSFFEANVWTPGTAAFAIGKSTAAELVKKGVSNVHIPKHPDKFELFKMSIDILS